jgi:hypothetical protein
MRPQRLAVDTVEAKNPLDFIGLQLPIHHVDTTA